MYMQGIPINTKRLELRLFNDSDFEEIHSVLSNPRVMRFSLNGAYSEDDTRRFLQRFQTSYKENGFGLYAVVHKDDDRIIGYCGLVKQMVDDIAEIEIGYRLDPEYWNRGLATEAASAVLEYALNTLELKKLISIIEDENIASIRVAVKNGFSLEKRTSFKEIPVGIYVYEESL